MKTLLMLIVGTVVMAPKPPMLVDSCDQVPRPEAKVDTVLNPDEGEQTFTDLGTANSYVCAGKPDRFYFTEQRVARSLYPRCWKVVEEAVSGCEDPPKEDPANFAPTPPVDPTYNEHDPIGPTDDGKPGAPTVDKPAP
jgi:hypothetical protein